MVVEVREEVREAAHRDAPRVFRLSNSISDSGLILERPAPFEVGRPVTASFLLPDLVTATPLALRATVELIDSDGDGSGGGSHLIFVEPRRETRQLIVRYVMGRLGLPGGEPRQ